MKMKWKFTEALWLLALAPKFVTKIFDLVDFLWAGTKEFYALANFTERKRNIAFFIVLPAATGLAVLWPQMIWLLALAPVAFIQNMFFTLVSRSRNSQDTDYHRYCAWGSNGVWFVCQVMIVKNIWGAIMAGQWWYAIAAGIVYSLATTEGSVLMMKRLIATEKGKRRVGASDKIEGMEARIKVLENMIQLGAKLDLPTKEEAYKTDAVSKLSIKTPPLEDLMNTSKIDDKHDARFDNVEKHIDTV